MEGYTFYLPHSGWVRCQERYGQDALAYFNLATDIFTK
jgi:hypothetical protein